MDWYSVGIAVTCGVVGAVAMALATANSKKAKFVKIIATVVLFSIVYAIVDSSFIPGLMKQAALAELEDEVLADPSYEALEEYAPETMEEIRIYLSRAIDESHDTLLANTNVRQILKKAVASRLGRSSDNAILEMYELVVDQLKFLQERGDDSCFRLMHPAVVGGDDASALLSEELLARENASTQSILSSYDSDMQAPDESQAQEIYNAIVATFVEEHGQLAVDQMTNVSAPETDRELVCTLTIEFLSAILSRSVDESVLVLRWLSG